MRNYRLPKRRKVHFTLHHVQRWLLSPIKTAVVVFIVLSIIVGTLSRDQYSDHDFLVNILVEAHGMLIELLIIGTFLLWLDQRRGKGLQATTYQEEIDDFRNWKSEEATYKIVGNMRRLNSIGITEISVYNCFLKKAQLNNIDLTDAIISGADLGQAHLRTAKLRCANLSGVYLGDAVLRGADLSESDLQRARCQRSNFRGADPRHAHLWRTEFYDADLEGANLSGADLTDAKFNGASLCKTKLLGAQNSSVEQLLLAKDLRDIQLEPHLEEAIKRIKPTLLTGPIRK